MRKWFSIVSSLGGWGGLLSYVFGLPGHIDDAITWLKWSRVMQEFPALLISIGFVVTGPLIWTSEWWWPFVVSRIKGQSQPATVSSISHAERDMEQFKACLPHIQRCRELIAPFASPFGTVNMGLEFLSTGGDKIIELISELGYLAKRLNSLGISCPNIYGSSDESDTDFRVRMRIWSTYLAELEVTIRQDDLPGARLLVPLVKQRDACVEKPQ